VAEVAVFILGLAPSSRVNVNDSELSPALRDIQGLTTPVYSRPKSLAMLSLLSTSLKHALCQRTILLSARGMLKLMTLGNTICIESLTTEQDIAVAPLIIKEMARQSLSSIPLCAFPFTLGLRLLLAFIHLRPHFSILPISSL
jgi:hypothetical protein